jgi:hypothetical protein
LFSSSRPVKAALVWRFVCGTQTKRRGELASLIGVENRRPAVFGQHHLLHRIEAEIDLHAKIPLIDLSEFGRPPLSSCQDRGNRCTEPFYYYIVT